MVLPRLHTPNSCGRRCHIERWYWDYHIPTFPALVLCFRLSVTLFRPSLQKISLLFLPECLPTPRLRRRYRHSTTLNICDSTSREDVRLRIEKSSQGP